MKHVLPLRVRLILLFAATAFGILTAATAGAAPPPPTPTELYFSEYIEGSSNNKALEIYNGTGSAVNLATGLYKIQMYFNGAVTATLTINLTGTVAAGDVYVVAQSSASATILAQADQTNGSGWFNGNDVVVLVKNTTIIDSIGQIGNNPGTEWGTGLTSTADNTLRRKATVCGGDTIATDTFDPSVEWDGFANDTFGDLGTYIGCGSTAISGTGAANPSAVPQGGTTTLTVNVSPGSSPPSTGIQVKGDLTSIGGSATQAFFDDGLTGGDVTAGDNIFTYTATVAPATTPGSKSLPISISDAQLRSASTSIALSVVIPLAIHEIQGSGDTSPYAGSPVQTTGIVTGVKTNGFFIQTASGFGDADPNTSEGIFVFTSSTPPGAATVGNAVRVTGTVQEFIPGADLNSPPTTEIISPSVSVLSTGNPLPAPIVLTAADTNPAGPIDQLEKYEGMRVQVNSLTVVAPTQGTVSEPNATSTSNGVFYGVITGIARPFRERGIEVPDPTPAGVPSFDANPERLRVDSDGVGGPIINVSTGAVLTNVVGPLDYAFRAYTIDRDTTTPTQVSGGILAAIPVPAPAADQFTVAAFNMERFFDTVEDPAVSDVVLTATAFNNRLNKASLAIRDVLRTPDIVGVEEFENLSTLQALATKINNDAVAALQPNPNYQAYLVEGNDIGGIDVGFLVKSSRVNVIDAVQYGKDTTYTNPNNNSEELLNDRPPLVLRATVSAPAGAPFPITVIVNHLRSFNGVDDPVDGPRVRAKRAKQAEFLANLIQTRQTANPNEHIVSLGDYNAYEFSDGYVDTIGIIIGDQDPCSEVVYCSPTDLVNPNLIELAPAAPSERYSYSFDGNAQVLDHEQITQNLSSRFEGLIYARNDADFADTLRNDPNRPERISDHDPAIAYFRLPLLSSLSPANVWVGLKNSDDVGIKFDLRAEVYYNESTLVGSGELASAVGGSSGFNNAKLDSIPLNLPTAIGIAPGDKLSIKLLVRNACSGSGKNSGTARLWFNDSQANSRFDATVDDANSDLYLLDGSALGTSAGPGPKKTIDVAAGGKCSAWKTFGTWTITE